MKKPTPEQFGLTESQLASLEKERGNYNALVTRIGRLVKLVIASGVISAIALYIGYGFDWPLFIPMLLIGAVFMSYLSPLVTETIVSRLDPHSRLHKLRSEYQVKSIIYRALWSSAYWEAFWKALSEGGNCVARKDCPPELPHSGLSDLPDPGGELFLMAGERYVLAMPRPSEPINGEFADRLLKTVALSSAQKGIICSDVNIPQEVLDVLKFKSIGILPSHLFLISRVLRLAVLQASIPILESATGPFATRWHQYCAKFRESELPFPSSMIRQAIAAELKESPDEMLQPKLGTPYLMLENFLPDEQVVQYDKLREFGEEAARGMQAGKSALEILSPLSQIQIDRAIDTEILERMKQRLEELEVFKEIAARNVKSQGG